jgi:hypothetical protein
MKVIIFSINCHVRAQFLKIRLCVLSSTSKTLIIELAQQTHFIRANYPVLAIPPGLMSFDVVRKSDKVQPWLFLGWIELSWRVSLDIVLL